VESRSDQQPSGEGWRRLYLSLLHFAVEWADYFENDYILLTNVDRFVAERARELMMAAYSKIKPPDAVRLATAAISPNVDELHTFDGRLLNLDGLINKEGGGTLKICKPNAGGSPAPLLEAMHAGKPPEDSTTTGQS
jgi:hypothetical protein